MNVKRTHLIGAQVCVVVLLAFALAGGDLTP
jgi:hypothetical protein